MSALSSSHRDEGPCTRSPDLRDRPLVLIRGGGDLASGTALRLLRSGFAVVVAEVARPTAIRRTVAFAEAVYEGRAVIEGVEGVRAEPGDDLPALIGRGAIPVVVDPEAALRQALSPSALVDAIMAKRNTGTRIDDAPAVVALGPGFHAGRDVHAVIETRRGHTLGRVITSGAALPDTGLPGETNGLTAERVVRSPRAGVFRAARAIGDHVRRGEPLGDVDGMPVVAAIDGVLRGLLHTGLRVSEGFKVADIDPRGDGSSCLLVSDKALAVAGGVLEAVCTLLGGVRSGPCPELAPCLRVTPRIDRR